MTKRRVVGLLVMTELPEMGLVAVLQRRGEFNHEKMGPESFPGALQLTVWGGMEDDETPYGAMLREAEEELGKDVLSMLDDPTGKAALDAVLRQQLGKETDDFLKDLEIDLDAGKPKEIYRFEDKKNLKVAYAAKLPCEFLRNVRLGPSSGGIRLLKEEEIGKIQDLKNFDKAVGVTDRNVLAMFADTKETIKRAFALAKQ